jgi:two-component system chemotaxis sensor kinase CheA
MPRDPYKYFRIEAQELLEQLGQGALDLEKGAPSGDVFARLLRVAHTLKGAARVVRQLQIAEHAHNLEDVLAALRDSTEWPHKDQIDVVLALLDQISVRLAALAPGRDPDASAPVPIRSHEPLHVFRPESADIESLVDGVAETQTHLAALRQTLDQTDRVQHLIELVGDQLARFRARGTSASGEGAGMEKALSMVHELRARFNALERGVLYGVDHMERELREVSDAAARLRLVPASAVFLFLERATRDVAQALGKRVTFEGRGDVRLDGGVLTIVQGALLQLVRNAVAHGIESSENERRAAGKPLDGHVTVVVSRRGAVVSFLCSDDGGGIDFDAVRRILQRKGLADTERQTFDTDALLRLLLKGGISTSGTVTDVAGRGIGLDVVRAAAERLGGEVSMRSQPGKGTTVELVVPSTISSFQALLVEAANVAAGVPLDAVRRTFRVTPEEIIESPQGNSIVHGGKSISLASLHRMLGPPERHSRAASACPAFVVEVGDLTAAFAVDRVLGTATVVMRPLPELAPAAPFVVGASLEAGCAPRLILDPASLVAGAQRLGLARPEPVATRPSILVIDDSLTTRMLEQSILESAGYDVSLASSGEEALEKARANTYALFLVDVEMPGIDGFTFIERVRADPTLRAIPSILVTSRASTDDRQRGRDVGAQGYIVKADFDQGVLLDQIRALVH